MYKHLYESAEQLDFPEPDIWISFNAGHVAVKLRLSEASVAVEVERSR